MSEQPTILTPQLGSQSLQPQELRVGANTEMHELSRIGALYEADAVRPTELRANELDSYYASAQYSQEWKDKLSNPGRIAKAGRAMLNMVGVQSPQQKAVSYHETIIQNYTNSVGLEGAGADITGHTAEAHAAARDMKLAQEEAEGSITSIPYKDTLPDVEGPRLSSGVTVAAHLELKNAEKTFEENRGEKLEARIQEAIDRERAIAEVTGQAFTRQNELAVRSAMLRQAMAVDQSVMKTLDGLVRTS